MAARKKMNEIAAGVTGLVYGSAPFQDHHGGALWLKDAQGGWFLVRNLAGIEWSAQFCADPAKVDLLRQNAKRLYDLLAPEIKQELDPGGLLDTPIQDAAGVASWTDSIFNAGVPLQPSFHTGVIHGGASAAGQDPTSGQDADLGPGPDLGPAVGCGTAAGPDPEPAVAQESAAAQAQEPAGVHHYPTPIVDIQLFKYDDFQLWVTDGQGIRPRWRPWPRAAAETHPCTCSTPRRVRSWPSRSKRRKARTHRWSWVRTTRSPSRPSPTSSS